MNKSFTLRNRFLALAITAITVFTVSDGFARGDGPRHLNFLQKELELSDHQAEQIHNIIGEFRDRFFENRDNKDKIKELRNERHEAIKGVLTEDQANKFDKLREKRKERRKCRRGRGPGSRNN